MAVPIKRAIDISFAGGLDTKTDPKRVQIGNFRVLQNSVFDHQGLLQKRNGNKQLTSLPNNKFSYLTTFNNNLTAIDDSIMAYDSPNNLWINKGSIAPLSLSVLPLVRNNFNQSAVDAAVSPNGLVCVAYLEFNGTDTVNKYAIYDATTSQNIVMPTLIPPLTGAVSGGMRVFVVGVYFVIVFTNTISAAHHLQYIAISINNPTDVIGNNDITTAYVPATTLSWDGYVVNNALFVSYDTTTGGQSVKVTKLTTTTIAMATAPPTPISFAGSVATMMSITADITSPSNPSIYVSFYDSSSSTGYTAIIDQNLNLILAPVEIISSGTILNITSAAQNGAVSVFYEVSNAYSFDASVPTNFIDSVSVTVGGIVSSVVTTIRSVGLASKAFIINGVIYFLSAFQSPYQSSYFLINGSLSLSSSPVVTAKIAYENGGGYLTTGLPGVTVTNNVAEIPYLFKDLITSVNKNTNVATGTQVAGIYSQTGINIVSFEIGTQGLDTVEIGNDLLLSGGFLWMYDGQVPVEQNFLVYPDTDVTNPSDMVTWSTTGGHIHAQPDGITNVNAYYYQFVYEWTDNQGNAFRSAPSIPVALTTTGSGNTGSVAINVPTLRLTYKVGNSPVKISVYRWSVAQEVYYEVTSIITPVLNDTTVDQVTGTDTSSDAFILGNAILYTTGGVVEDIGPPATNIMTLFDTRLWLVDAEDQNLLWYSKQVIEATPVEMSDLFTIYISPTVGAEGSTGPITALAPMDDKLIIFKQGTGNAIYYINGTGPDNTGANSQYSEPIFVTSTVGCSNQLSIVFIPQGLMFQSNKGIWLLDRGLNTSYIGAPVEQYTTGAIVESAQNIPATNQVRFILNTGITLMYDYYYGQWGTFTGIPAISSCIFQQLHTFINSYGQAFQENPGSYLDGSTPVLMSLITGPIRLGDLQNFQRTYFYYILGTYISPHKLYISNYYDYSEDASDSRLISPTNPSPAYGQVSPYGQQNLYGGPTSLENWRIFAQRRCMALAIGIEEIYDPSYGVPAGAGLTLSGISLVCGFKSYFKTISSAHTAG
jgi:hypothetical protein